MEKIRPEEVKTVYDAIEGSIETGQVSWVFKTDAYTLIQEVKDSNGSREDDIRLPIWEDVLKYIFKV